METMRRYSRRAFVAWVGGAGAGFYLFGRVPGLSTPVALAQIPVVTLDPAVVPKFATPMLIPPVMPRAATIRQPGAKPLDYYEISMRQIQQQILPAGLPKTTVWGYGAIAAENNRGLLIHNAPSLTIEAMWNRPVRVKWINDLVDKSGEYLPHLLPVDQTLHWANPPGGPAGRDSRPTFAETPGAYKGPVPIVTHVHGAVGVADDSDGYAEAWYLPAAGDIPSDYATEGTWYDFFAGKAAGAYGVEWGPGYATFQYPNDNRASTIWYHDHALGMTRLNVYAGPAGFYLVRGGPAGDSTVLDSRTGLVASLPGPAPRENDKFPPNKPYREIPIAIQDRSFNEDGSLFYPDSRTFFDGLVGDFIPEGPFSPIWNPEFFGNTIMVNGNTWPFLAVEQRRYRFRFLNGCQSRFLILDFGGIPGVEAWQIGNEGGFLAAPVDVTADHGNRLLMGLAERADVIVDFTTVPVGNHVLGNVGPDEPFGGGIPGDDFPVADPATTGQIMQFNVVPAVGSRHVDATTVPAAARDRAAPGRDDDPAAGADREGGRGRGRRRRGGRGAGRGPARHGRGRRSRGEALDGLRDREPGRRCDRGLGVLQRHGRRAPDACPRGHVRGGEPPGPAAGRGGRGRRADPARRRRQSAGTVGVGLQGHRDRLSRAGHAFAGAVRHARASSYGTATSSSTRTTR